MANPNENQDQINENEPEIANEPIRNTLKPKDAKDLIPVFTGYNLPVE